MKYSMNPNVGVFFSFIFQGTSDALVLDSAQIPVTIYRDDECLGVDDFAVL